MPEAADFPFAFLRDLLAQGDEPDDEGTLPRPDPESEGAKAALLDATVSMLAALQKMLQAAEDLVRVRRDRLGGGAPEPPSPPAAQPHGRERLDLSY